MSAGQVQQRRGEDDGHDAGHVDLDRDVGVVAAVRAPADHALGVLHRDAPLRLLDEHDGDDDHEADREDDRGRPRSRCDCAIAQSEPGNGAAIDVKIRSDMPLPMPRSVMSSPIHMMRPVPAVIVMTMSRMRVPGVVRDELLALGDAGRREQRARAGDGDERRRLQHAERDREVARVLRELGLARLALLVEGLEVRDDDAQQLHDDRRGDVRHDAEREDRELQQRAAREEVDELVEARCCPGWPRDTPARSRSRRTAPG